MSLNLCQKYILKFDRFVENKNILKGNFLIILKNIFSMFVKYKWVNFETKNV